MINIFGIGRKIGLPNGDVMEHNNCTLSASIDKLTDKLVLEFRNPIGTFNKFVFEPNQEQQLREFMNQTERL